MNIQGMMKQAQKMQKEIQLTKEEINKTLFEEETENFIVKIYGSKKVDSINIKNKELLNVEDKEILEDMLVVSINNCLNKIDKETELKLQKYGSALNGLI